MRLVFLISLLFLTQDLFGQWNTDPSINNTLSISYADSVSLNSVTAIGESDFILVLRNGSKAYQLKKIDSSGIVIQTVNHPVESEGTFFGLMPDRYGGAYSFAYSPEGSLTNIDIGYFSQSLEHRHIFTHTAVPYSFPQISLDSANNLWLSVHASATIWPVNVYHKTFRCDTSFLHAESLVDLAEEPYSTVRISHLPNGNMLKSAQVEDSVLNSFVYQEYLYDSSDNYVNTLWDTTLSKMAYSKGDIDQNYYTKSFASSNGLIFQTIDLSDGDPLYQTPIRVDGGVQFFGRPVDWVMEIDEEAGEVIFLVQSEGNFLNHIILCRFDLFSGDQIGNLIYLYTNADNLNLVSRFGESKNSRLLAYVTNNGDIRYHRYKSSDLSNIKQSYLIRSIQFYYQYSLPIVSSLGVNGKRAVYVWTHYEWFYREFRAMAIDELGLLQIDDMVDHQVRAYPNPTDGYLRLEIPEFEDIESVRAVAIDGREVSIDHSNKSALLNLTQLPSGHYTLIIQTSESKVYRTSIVRK